MAEARKSYEFSAPFWCVQPTGKSAEVNMHFDVITVKKLGVFLHCGEYQVTVLINSKALLVGDVLRYAADPKLKYPPQSSAKRSRAA